MSKQAQATKRCECTGPVEVGMRDGTLVHVGHAECGGSLEHRLRGGPKEKEEDDG